MKGLIFSCILMVSFLGFLKAQLNIGGKPLSYEMNDRSEKINIPLIEFSDLNNQLLRADAEENQSKDQPWQFGLNREVNVDIKSMALIDKVNNGKLYRLVVFSRNALTLNFRFDAFKIPDRAVLYMYNEDKSDMLGGFTSRNNQNDSIFATGLIKGDKIIFEYFEPDNVDFEGTLILSQVTHGFRSLSEYSKSFGQSGDCNMNVACPDGLEWSNEIRSVCMLVTGGSAFCSATLINNTLSDGTPYVLTANHCNTAPSSTVFVFNWESESCENPPVSPAHQDLSGAVFIAQNDDSDFFLMKINDTPPYDYNVYYAGWYKENEFPSTSVCIHHPRGDIKKISFDDHPAVSDQYLGYYNPLDSHWKVIWDRSTTTEGGSSGSPLFNQNHRLIGQLHGGFASCNDLDSPDWYGKFSYSWNTGTTPVARLKEWLDPINIGISDMPGYDPNIPLYDTDAQLLAINSPIQNIYDLTPITPSLKIRNIGNNPLSSLTVKYSVNNEITDEYLWTGNLSTGEIIDIEFDPITLPSGKHEFLVYVTNPNGIGDEFRFNDTIRLSLNIYEPIFKDDFENGQFWYLTGEFEIDKPKGLGGGTGNPDPKTAFSGNYVLGTDLTGQGQHQGDYENDLAFYDEYAQSPAINCSKYENVILKFKRYLGIDIRNFDNASVELFDGLNWDKLWANAGTAIMDTNWSEQIINLTDYAEGKVILLKFTMGPTDDGDQYCGWNIDDVEVFGTMKRDTVIDQATLTVYPNPAKHYFYIQFRSDNSKTATVSISDITGKIRWQKSYSETEILESNNQNLIYVEYGNSDKGLFIIRVITENDSYTGKIILY
jgi:hypothetical protein